MPWNDSGNCVGIGVISALPVLACALSYEALAMKVPLSYFRLPEYCRPFS
ncbi:hypothetical protein OKW42_000776 [Paraburkholderia sp. WC7.3d]